MARRSDITAEIVRDLLDYDSETGVLTWRWRDVKWFEDTPTRSASWSQRNWNSRRAGTAAFPSPSTNGYPASTILGRRYHAHRIAWLHAFGRHPVGEIDHINHNRSDNRLVNLREVTRDVNMRNISKSVANTSGITGVHWDSQTSKWRAEIRVNHKTYKLGRFDEKEDAAKARKAAEVQYGFHENHGAA